jgi:hypothetical protein
VPELVDGGVVLLYPQELLEDARGRYPGPFVAGRSRLRALSMSSWTSGGRFAVGPLPPPPAAGGSGAAGVGLLGAVLPLPAAGGASAAGVFAAGAASS